MPSRIIRESIRTSPTLDMLSAEAERMFYRLTVSADDFGRLETDPRLVLATAFPLRIGTITIAEIETWLQELVTAGALVFYEVAGRRYGYFPTWTKHQRLYKDRPSKFPDPPAISGHVPELPGSSGLCPPLTNPNPKTKSKSEGMGNGNGKGKGEFVSKPGEEGDEGKEGEDSEKSKAKAEYLRLEREGKLTRVDVKDFLRIIGRKPRSVASALVRR